MKLRLNRKETIEYAILLGVALFSLLYLALRDRGEINYTLPEFPVLTSDEFTSLEILQPGGAMIELSRESGEWLTDDGYPVDSGILNRMLTALEEFSPVDLVAESGNLARYELDDAHRYTLKGYKGEKLIRELYLGKPSASENYNYVLFPGSNKIYTLRGALVKTTRLDAEGFRSREIISLDRNGVGSISLSSIGQQLQLTKNSEEQWADQDGTIWEKQQISEFLGRVAALKAVGFPETTPDKTDSLLTITLKGSEELNLTLFEKVEEGYPALLSG